MAKKDNIKGVVSIEMGTPGDGVVGTSLSTFTDVVEGSVNIIGAEVQTTNIATEQDPAYATVESSSTPQGVEFSLYGIEGAKLVELIGGSWDSATKTYKGPKKAQIKNLSVVLNTDVFEGQSAKITFPSATVVAKQEGTITKDGLMPTLFVVTANTPRSAAGVEGAPYEIQYVAV